MRERNVPEVRFRGFCEEWGNKELEALAVFSKGNGFSKSDLVNVGFPIILYGRLYTKYETLISNVDTFIADNSNAIMSKGNEVIVPASGETAEDISRASVVGEKGIVLGGDLNIIYPSEDLIPAFLALSISNGTQQREMMKRAQGKSVVHLHNSDLSEIKLTYPIKLEQTKIGEFFKNLDNLIAQNQKKYDKLVNMKKACLDKMFPKDGADTPEVRFKGFSEKWEKKGFLQVAKYKNGKAHENSICEDGKFVVINSKFVSTNSEVRKHTDIQIEPLYKNDLAFVLSDVPNGRAIAKTFFVDAGNKYSLNQRIAGISALESIYPYFLHLLLNRNKYFLMFDDGVKQTNLSVQDIYNFVSCYPNKNEQTKIGTFFHTLDNLITLHKTELEKLKNIKKACLDKMFI